MNRAVIIMVILLGITLLFAQGIPDYTFATGTSGSLEDMSTGTTTLLSGYSDSGASPVTDIGFTFVFAGNVYTQFSANANGLMRLGSNVISGSTSPVANAAILGAISGDNSIQAGGKIHYKVVGSAPNRRLVVEWYLLRVNYSSTDTTGPFCTLQAWLYEGTNKIDYVYGTMYNRSTSAQTRAVFISSSNVANTVGCVATITTTPSWITTSSSLTTTSFTASSYMTNLNSDADGSRRVFTFTPPVQTDPPNPAVLVYPYDAGWAFTDAILSWGTGGGVPTSYDLYLDTVNPPVTLVGDDLAVTTYDPALDPATTYYWQVVPRNDNGEASDCPVWSFTTPRVDQLAESFDATAFPPVGWANPNTWSRTTTTPYYGAGTAYKSLTTTPAILSTPLVAIDAGSELDFYYRTAATTGYGLLNIKYSTDRVNWSQVGATISLPTTTTWNHAVVALGAIPAGNYFLGFEGFTSTSTGSIYLDYIFGPDLAAVAPGPATPTAPANAATNVVKTPTFTWTAPTTGGVPTGYKIYCDTNTEPTTLLGSVTGVNTLTWTATTALAYSTVYYWKVVAYNTSGDATGNTVFSFTTVPDPTIYTMPWLEDFGTTDATFPPTNWSRYSGALADPSTLASGSTVWGQDNWLNDTTVTPVNFSARMNIYSTGRYHWIITPPIQMPGTGYQLEFDIGLTDYANSNPISSDPNGTTGVDDKFIVLIGDGVTWTPANILRQYDNAGSPYVYNNISHLGDHLIFPLDAYTGIKHIAFYGESTVSNADNDFFVDNVMIRQTPAGAPEHVTLTSPVDGATDLYPENTVLSWSAALTGGTPAYYEVFVGASPIDPGIGYYGEYFYETENTNLNLSAQGDIDLGFSTTWYWAVLPYNEGGEAPDPDAPEFMIWDFTTIADPTIVALPHEEYFDGVTAPALPYGWTSVVQASVTTAYVNTYSSTTYSVSAPNVARLYNSTDAAANVMLITPNITVPINTIKAKFYARGSTAGQVLLVGTVNTADNTFTQMGSIATTAAQVQYEVSFDGYAGTDTHIAFKHGLGATSRTIYLDNVQLIELLPVDLAATSIAGPGILEAGNPYDFTVSVFNEGTTTINSYDVNLKRYGDDMLASVAVTDPIAPGATAQITIPWTPAIGGTFQVYGEVVATGDGSPANDETALKEVYILDNTMDVIAVGDDATTTNGYYLPINMYYRNNISEQLYFTDEMHLQSGTITALVYKNTFLNERLDKPIKIWMAHTTVTDLSAGWLPAIDYTLVFDGTVDFPAGVNYVIIPLTTPFSYTGGTLATRVYRVFDNGALSSSDKFYYTTNPAHTTRSRYLQNDSIVYDPMAPSAAGTTLNYFSNTMFVVQNAVMQTGAIMQGYVYETDGTTPIQGATVTLTDERYATTTDATGFYQFTFWEAHNVNAVASKATYYNSIVNGIALTMGNTVNQNFILTAMPRVTVNGMVNANDAAFLAGATVELNGPESFELTTLADGTFTIPGVLGSNAGLAYTVTVSKEGYQSYSGNITVYEASYDLGTITLIEYLWTAYDLVATHENGNARLTWDPAGEPDYLFFDFETDNGGWVGSGYGDWEWSNNYDVANFTYSYTGTSVIPPAAAHSGDGMWGTKMLTNYSNSGAFSYLTLTADLAGFTAPQIRFWSWENTFGNFDYCQLAINGTLVWGPSWDYSATQWRERVVDLSAYAGQQVTIQFQMFATTSVNYAGWYIDDIYIGPAPRQQAASNSRSIGTRSFEDYDLYRLLPADQATPANWTPVATGLTATTYLDEGFGTITGGTYKWALKANYTGALESAPIFSNILGKVYMPQDIAATTVGATVVLSWTAEPGAAYYKVYASDDPYGTFNYLGYSATNGYTVALPEAKKFYKVTAVADEAMPTPAPALSK